jgi:SMC interacting uncharacterized protein involved in chromosome segregation
MDNRDENMVVTNEWSVLHLRAARGETLSSEENAAYQAGLQRLHESESFSGEDLALMRQARAEIAALEAEQQELRAQHDALRAQIARLEAALDERARQALGLSTVALLPIG